MTDIFTPEIRRALMARVRTRDTDIERKLKVALIAAGYKLEYGKDLPGKPDLVLKKEMVAIFCDGDFWHGKNFEKDKGRYSDFWRKKIETNRLRDRKVTKTLRKSGWLVLRFWKTDINKNTGNCVLKVVKAVSRFRLAA